MKTVTKSLVRQRSFHLNCPFLCFWFCPVFPQKQQHASRVAVWRVSCLLFLIPHLYKLTVLFSAPLRRFSGSSSIYNILLSACWTRGFCVSIYISCSGCSAHGHAMRRPLALTSALGKVPPDLSQTTNTCPYSRDTWTEIQPPRSARLDDSNQSVRVLATWCF